MIASTGLMAMPHAHGQDLEAAPAIGVQFHAMWSDYSTEQRVEVLDKLAAAGVEWVRVDMGWASFEERAPGAYERYHVDLADWVVNEARARGIKVLATLWRTPDWANGGAGPVAPPDDPGDYARIARWAAEHFRGRVDAWEVWNEPNLKDFFAGTAAEYVALLKAAYPGFKAGDPDAEVVLGGPSYNDTGWLEKMYAAGGGGYFDVMATHPYQGMADAPPETPDDGTIWTLSHVAAVHELMQKNGDGDKEIWFTELGWSSHPNGSSEKNWTRGVTAQQQADYLIRTIRYVAENFPYVTNMFWYNDRNRDTGNVHLDNYGILNRDLSPKPIYHALVDYNGGVSEVPISSEQSANLLPNGSFEEGRTGWIAADATLRAPTVEPGSGSGIVATVSGPRDGDRVGKIVPRGRGARITSSRKASGQTTYTAGGFITARAGQFIRFALVEKVDGRVVAKQVTNLRASGEPWQVFPPVALTTSGRDNGKVSLKVRSSTASGKAFLVDDLWLVTI